MVHGQTKIKVQKLSDEDHRRRIDFCLHLQDFMSADDHFLEKAQFSDEATFHVSWCSKPSQSQYMGI